MNARQKAKHYKKLLQNRENNVIKIANKTPLYKKRFYLNDLEKYYYEDSIPYDLFEDFGRELKEIFVNAFTVHEIVDENGTECLEMSIRIGKE